MINAETILSRRSEVDVRNTPTGAILVDMRSGACFRLNRTGAQIWSLLETPRGFGDIAREVSARYQLASSQVEGDLTALVESLERADLLVSTPPLTLK